VKFCAELSTPTDPHVIDLPLDALALLAAYIAVTVIAPRLLSNARILVRYPHLTIGLWVASLALSVGLLWAGTGLIIAEWIRRIQFGESLENWASSVAGSILTWISIAVLGVIVFRLSDASQSVATDRAAQIASIAPLLRGAVQTEIAGHRVYVVESLDRILAAVPFANAIVVTRNLVDTVPQELLRAGIEHERAHLVFRHSVLVSIAQLAVSAAGGIKASRRFTQTIRIAIELVADDWAARRVGRATVANALEAIYPSNADVTERIARLRSHVAD
jgi:Zn-dependent protease with chaperone function